MCETREAKEKHSSALNLKVYFLEEREKPFFIVFLPNLNKLVCQLHIQLRHITRLLIFIVKKKVTQKFNLATSG